MKTLIIHHLESIWEQGYKKFGYTTESLIEKFLTHLVENEYDKVILTQFENWQPQPEHQNYYEIDGQWVCLADFVTDWECYGYGGEVESYNTLDLTKNDRLENWAGWRLLGRGVDWEWGGTHSEVVELQDWQHSLQDKIFLTGAFDGECVEDMEIALDSLNKEYTRIENLII